MALPLLYRGGMSMRSAVGLVMLGWLAGCAVPPEPQATDSETTGEVTNGRVETGRFNVPRLSMETTLGRSGCTATLIGTHTLLTAAHCVAKVNGSLTATFPKTGDVIYGKRAEMHGSYDPSQDNEANSQFDVAVVELERDVALEPARIATTAPVEGQKITLVGYGITSRGADDFGTLHSGTNTIENVAAYTYEIKGASDSDANVCGGDSGGPDFSTIGGIDYIVGVHSRANCDAMLWGYDLAGALTTRADSAVSFIRTTARGDLYAGDGHYEKKPPVVSIDAPAKVVSADTAFDVTIHATDDLRVVGVRLLVDSEEVYSGGRDEPTFDITRTLTLTRGTHQLDVEATDGAGNRAVARATTVVGNADATVPDMSNNGEGANPDDDMAHGSVPGASPASGCTYTDRSTPARSLLALALMTLALAMMRTRRRRTR